LSRSVKQEKVTDCGPAVREVKWGNVRISYSQAGLAFEGVAHQGETWSTLVPASNVLQCEVWSASLGGSNSKSLVIYRAPENGGTFGAELTILSFDQKGRPVPWQVDGAFTSTSQGIAEISQGAKDGEAQIVVRDRQGDPHDGFAYVTSLYKISGQSFSKVLGKDDVGATWPLVEGKRSALVGTEEKSTASIAASDVQDTVSSARSSERTVASVASFQNAEPVIYSDGTRSRFPRIVVFDSSDGTRKIFFDENAVDGVEQARKAGASVSLKGETCESEECRPFIMHAVSAIR
jgi:hypothetical protein